MQIPFYDPTRSYQENYIHGPFGAFADGKIASQTQQPKHTFFGHAVHLPFGIAAGPLLNGKYVKAALDKGFDLAVYKTVRTQSHPCHEWPNVLPVEVPNHLNHLSLETAQAGLKTKSTYSSPLAITNSFGVPSFDPDTWQPDMAEAVQYAKQGQVVIGSFQGTVKPGQSEQDYIDDFVLAAQLVHETGAPVLEANLSCPNEKSARLLCFDIERVKKIAVAIKEKIGNTPLVLKMAYFQDQNELLQFIKEVGPVADGLAAINTIAAKIYTPDGKQALPGAGRLLSGICGAPIQWAGLDMVSRLLSLRSELNLQYTIIGVGGVENAEGYHNFIRSGADAVMCATGAMWNPFLAQEIKQAVGK